MDQQYYHVHRASHDVVSRAASLLPHYPVLETLHHPGNLADSASEHERNVGFPAWNLDGYLGAVLWGRTLGIMQTIVDALASQLPLAIGSISAPLLSYGLLVVGCKAGKLS